MISQITNYTTILACYSIIVSLLFIIGRSSVLKQTWPVIFFLGCVLLYLTIEYFSGSMFFKLLLGGPFLLPFSFWILSKSIFSDKPMPVVKIFIIALLLLIVYYTLFFCIQKESSSDIFQLISAVISFFFVFLAVFEAQRGKGDDLITKRKQLRNIFMYVISIIVLLTLMAELGLQQTDQEFPKLIQRLSILAFSTYFLMKNANWIDFFYIEKKEVIEIKDPELIDNIQQRMVNGNFFSNENLTIKKLAEELNEQEYKIRQVINQQLGYRNFTNFLNSYRITEAKKILSDSSQKKITVLEIAYKVGFNSIGPFNRAFKTTTGLTPTDFRKKFLSNS